MNKVTVIGRLTVDPNTRNAGNSTVTTFGMAANSTHKNTEGAYTPVYYRVSVWGKSGEQCAKYLHKGDRCAVFGDLSTRQYAKKSGEAGFELQIDNASVEFLNTKPNAESQSTADSDDDDRMPF